MKNFLINARLGYPQVVYYKEVNMGLTSEDIVTQLLSQHEILGVGMSSFGLQEHTPIYTTESKYDLSGFLSSAKPEPGRFGEKYIFVR